MTVETLLLVATALLAMVAVVIAAVAVRTVRRLERQASQSVIAVADRRSAVESNTDAVSRAAAPPQAPNQSTQLSPLELAPGVVRGRVIVPPTQAQVVRTALGRPGVRLSVFAHGLVRALRPENRDRIVSLMRREYRHRRHERLRAGRLAIRTAAPSAAPSTERLGVPPAATLDSRSGGHAEFAEARPLSLTERMIGS